MTYAECYRRARDTLRRAGVESPAFDAMCLFEKAFGLDRAGLAVHGPQEAPPAGAQALEAWAARRAARRFGVLAGLFLFPSPAPQKNTGPRLPPAGKARPCLFCRKSPLTPGATRRTA